jgi:hypothetical protein
MYLISNDDPPVLDIEKTIITFHEGPDRQQPIITFAVNITDLDCGAVVTRARIVLSGGNNNESLNLTGGFLSLDHEYWPENATLIITGEANYEDVLKAVQYSNSNDEPGPDEREVTYSVFDGKHWSNVVTITITFRLINDHRPVLDMDELTDGKDFMVTFNEGSSGVFIASTNHVKVTDGDTDALIHTVVVKLQSIRDGSAEGISTTDSTVVSAKNITTFTFTFMSPKNLSETEAFIETLQYTNNATNPTEDERQALVKVNDGSFYSNEATVSIEVNTRNDPPMFSQNFSGVVVENSPSALSIAQVEADDPDGDSIDYIIIEGDDMGYFEINSSTGEITTTDIPLDRETQDSYTVTVMASDGMLNDTTTVSIFVTDENDNCPAFGNTSYSTTILSTTAIGSEVVSLVIHDDDLTDNFQAAITSGNSNGLFGIVNHTIVVVTSLSDSNFATIKMTVTLTDSDQHECTGVNATVTIVVLSTLAQFQFSVEEEQPTGTEVGQLITDPSFHNIEYDISGADSAPFSINHLSVISTTAVLDRENIPQHTLTIVFTIDTHQVIATVQITVNDTNDNFPEFSLSSYDGSVSEDASLVTTVDIGISATDRDYGINAQLEFTVLGTSQFQISTTGTIEVSNSLDYETKCSHSFQVIATDGGGKSSNATVLMIVNNVNEHPPAFDSFTDPKIPVSLQPGDNVIRIVATDPDHCPTEPDSAGTVSYDIAGNPGSFRINSTTGLIQVNSSLSVGSTILTVRAYDNDGNGNGRMSEVEVEVTVTQVTVDLNGNEQDNVHTSVTLSESSPAEIYLVDALATGVVQSNSQVISVTITLTNPQDGGNERLSVTPQASITVWQVLKSVLQIMYLSIGFYLGRVQCYNSHPYTTWYCNC